MAKSSTHTSDPLSSPIYVSNSLTDCQVPPNSGADRQGPEDKGEGKENMNKDAALGRKEKDLCGSPNNNETMELHIIPHELGINL